MVRLVILRTLESYFRHRWLYLLPVLLMTAASVVYFFQVEPVFFADGVVFVQKESFLASLTAVRGGSYSWNTPAQDTKNEFDELLQTDAFIRAMIQKTDLEEDMDKGPEVLKETIGKLREAVWLQSDGTNQVRIVAGHEDPVIAQQLVNAAFDTYIQWKINSDRNESQTAQDFFIELVGQYKIEMETARRALNDYLEAHPVPIRGDQTTTEQLEINRLQSELDLVATRYATVLENEENARLASSQTENDIRQTYFLIDAPQLPDKPGTSLKDTAINMVIFVVVGIMMSAIGIAGATLLDRSIRLPIDIHYGLHLKVLSEIPDMSPTKSRFKRKSRTNISENLQTDPYPQPQFVIQESEKPGLSLNSVESNNSTLDLREMVGNASGSKQETFV